MENSTEKTFFRRSFGIYFNELFVQGGVTIKIITSDNGDQSRREDFYFLIDDKEYFSIDELHPVFGSKLDGFIQKLQNILNK